MRLLGKCPACGTEDSITRGGKEVSCETCHASWENWVDLASLEEKKGNKLIPVDVMIRPGMVKVWFVRPRDMPAARFITSTCNTALMMRFKLGICTATEGGLQGRVRGRTVELRNIWDDIGLYDEYTNEFLIPEAPKILRWYGELLKLLFEYELNFEGKSYGRGAILKLDPKDPDYAKKVKFFLWLALFRKTRSRKFADGVFKRLNFELSQPMSGNYISGLTDEQVVAFFVPPPRQ